MMVAAAVIGGSVLTAGVGMSSANKAAKATLGAANRAADTSMAMYERTDANLAPFREMGEGAIEPLNKLALGSPEEIMAMLQELPGYQFTLDQGLKSTQNSFAARGLGTSGAAMKGAAQYATGLADQTYGNQFNRLLSMVQTGQNAAAQTGSAATAAGGQAANAYLTGGQGAANAYLAGGGAVNNSINNISNAFLMDAYLKNNGGPGIFT